MIPNQPSRPRAIPLIVTLAGLILTCCMCPLALNYIILIGSNGGSSLYGPLFSPFSTFRLGIFPATTAVITMQTLCATLLGLIILVLGIFMFIQARPGRQAVIQTPQPPSPMETQRINPPG